MPKANNGILGWAILLRPCGTCGLKLWSFTSSWWQTCGTPRFRRNEPTRRQRPLGHDLRSSSVDEGSFERNHLGVGFNHFLRKCATFALRKKVRLCLLLSDCMRAALHGGAFYSKNMCAAISCVPVNFLSLLPPPITWCRVALCICHTC